MAKKTEQGLPQVAALLASKGRNGDTMLAHINKQEAALLKAAGGSGTINPETGLPEFWFGSELGGALWDAGSDIVGGLVDAATGLTGPAIGVLRGITGGTAGVAEDIAGKLGQTVESIVSDPRKMAAVGLMIAYPGAASAVGEFLLPEAAAATLGATGTAIVGQTAINTALNGGDVDKAIKAAMIQQGLPAVTKELAASQFGKDMSEVLGKYGAQAATSAGIAAIMGRDPMAALVMSGADAAANVLMTQLPEQAQWTIKQYLSPTAQKAVVAAVASSLAGRDPNQAIAQSLIDSAIKDAQTFVQAQKKVTERPVLGSNRVKLPPLTAEQLVNTAGMTDEQLDNVAYLQAVQLDYANQYGTSSFLDPELIKAYASGEPFNAIANAVAEPGRNISQSLRYGFGRDVETYLDAKALGLQNVNQWNDYQAASDIYKEIYGKEGKPEDILKLVPQPPTFSEVQYAYNALRDNPTSPFALRYDWNNDGILDATDVRNLRDSETGVVEPSKNPLWGAADSENFADVVQKVKDGEFNTLADYRTASTYGYDTKKAYDLSVERDNALKALNSEAPKRGAGDDIFAYWAKSDAFRAKYDALQADYNFKIQEALSPELRDANAQKSGWEDFNEFAQAHDAGFTKSAQYHEAQAYGVDTYQEYQSEVEARGRGWVNAAERQAAEEAGFNSAWQYHNYLAQQTPPTDTGTPTDVGTPQPEAPVEIPADTGTPEQPTQEQVAADNEAMATERGFPDYATYQKFNGSFADYQIDQVYKSMGWDSYYQMQEARNQGINTPEDWQQKQAHDAMFASAPSDLSDSAKNRYIDLVGTGMTQDQAYAIAKAFENVSDITNADTGTQVAGPGGSTAGAVTDQIMRDLGVDPSTVDPSAYNRVMSHVSAYLNQGGDPSDKQAMNDFLAQFAPPAGDGTQEGLPEPQGPSAEDLMAMDMGFENAADQERANSFGVYTPSQWNTYKEWEKTAPEGSDYNDWRAILRGWSSAEEKQAANDAGFNKPSEWKRYQAFESTAPEGSDMNDFLAYMNGWDSYEQWTEAVNAGYSNPQDYKASLAQEPAPVEQVPTEPVTPTAPTEQPPTAPEPVIPEVPEQPVEPEVVEPTEPETPEPNPNQGTLDFGDTTPVTPTPVEPTPVEPTPGEPAPGEYTPGEPTPVTPEPVTPTPVEPTPTEPTPEPVTPEEVEPNPVEPTPVTPEPVTPTPVEPEPVTPEPVEPEPVEPTPEPVEPTPEPVTPPANPYENAPGWKPNADGTYTFTADDGSTLTVDSNGNVIASTEAPQVEPPTTETPTGQTGGTGGGTGTTVTPPPTTPVTPPVTPPGGGTSSAPVSFNPAAAGIVAALLASQQGGTRDTSKPAPSAPWTWDWNQQAVQAPTNGVAMGQQFFKPTLTKAAEGGLMALAGGGTSSSLGSYSDGGRLLRGPGDGMSDNIPAVIGNKQPARLGDGEFVVPADVVSHLGNGSTEAGAKVLYDMMDRVRKARTGSIKQGKQINPKKFMPK